VLAPVGDTETVNAQALQRSFLQLYLRIYWAVMDKPLIELWLCL